MLPCGTPQGMRCCCSGVFQTTVSKSKQPPSSRTFYSTRSAEVPEGMIEVVDPRWLVKVFLLAVAVAACCGYAVLCWFFWQGQWQLVLKPVKAISATPATTGLAFKSVNISRDETGKPQATACANTCGNAWWIPADATSAPSLLLLHGGDEDLSGIVPWLRPLHDAGLNILAVEYRGFGSSSLQIQHPDERSMQSDATAAFNYLMTTQHLAPGQVLLFGDGLGASVAVRLAAEHPVAGLILAHAKGDTANAASHDPRAHLVPFSLLFREQFPLAQPLHTLAVPKLLFSIGDAGGPPEVLKRAADPRLTVEFAGEPAPAEIATSVRRFLALYVPAAAASLPTSPAPAPSTPK
jgi:pimeloyl-ACP methyl ester carboxylesterase